MKPAKIRKSGRPVRMDAKEVIKYVVNLFVKEVPAAEITFLRFIIWLNETSTSN